MVPLELLGLYFADAGQHLENRLFVDHNQPRTRSNVDYKARCRVSGAHGGIGDVLIRKVAEGIETYESNKNLVLTDGCRADSVPNLEIETGEIVGAGHASTTGRFDDEQLFYLRSRGISESEARRLVVHGFFADIIRKIGVPELESQLLETLEAELAVNINAGWLMSEFVRACRAADVAPESAIPVEIGGTELAIVHSDGQFYAIADECSHASIPLSEGDGDGEIECYLHGFASISVPASRSGCRPPSPWPSIAAQCKVTMCSSTSPHQYSPGGRPPDPRYKPASSLETQNTQES